MEQEYKQQYEAPTIVVVEVKVEGVVCASEGTAGGENFGWDDE